MNTNIKIKLTDNTGKKDLSRFSVSYSFKKMTKEQASYEILSVLKGEDDIIIEITSSLINMGERVNKAVGEKLASSFDALGIEYIKKKTVVNARRQILSISIEGKKVEGFEFFAYIPDQVWKSKSFFEVLPENGVMYHILKPGKDHDLDAFSVLDENEKRELCSMSIFDNTQLSSMGINTVDLNKEELLQRLGK